MHRILCGGTKSPSSQKGDKAEVLTFDVQGANKNINLKIQDIHKSLITQIPDALMDLLEVAAYVYCADRHISRGGSGLSNMGADWRRQLHFVIPVRNPDLWKSQEMLRALSETLGFLSDDLYEFEFVKSSTPLNQPQAYLEFSSDADAAFFNPDIVALFSGGLDSFSGAVEAAAGQKKKIALVGHHASPKVFAVQRGLVKDLRDKGYGKNILYTPVQVTNANNDANPAEALQRIRSFLFASIGVTVAHLLNKQKITFYENGVVSLNFPLSGDVLGARATRTTHPRVLRGFEEIFSTLLQKEITVENPYQWKTKSEVIRVISEHGCAPLIAKTNSCTRPHLWTTSHSHCGVCSQCLDRRFSILAAALEQNDPADRYMVELLTAARDKEIDVMMAADYIKFAYEVSDQTRSQFQKAYPQLFDAVRYYRDRDVNQAAENIYDMIKRHADGVRQVIVNATKTHADKIASCDLPHSSLLSMAISRPDKIEVKQAPDISNDMDALKKRLDHLAAPSPEFYFDDNGKRVFFAGNFSIDGSEFSLVKALLPHFKDGKSTGKTIKCISTNDLAKQLYNGSEQSLRQQISRLHKKLADHLGAQLGIPDPDEFIENQKGQGYRINSRFRLLTSHLDFSLPQKTVTNPLG